MTFWGHRDSPCRAGWHAGGIAIGPSGVRAFLAHFVVVVVGPFLQCDGRSCVAASVQTLGAPNLKIFSRCSASAPNSFSNRRIQPYKDAPGLRAFFYPRDSFCLIHRHDDAAESVDSGDVLQGEA